MWCSLLAIVTVLRTELATLVPLSAGPEPMLSTFWASRMVFSRLAAAVADRPCACKLSEGRGVIFGRGGCVDAVVLVFAMEASVWTSELRRGVVRLDCEGDE